MLKKPASSRSQPRKHPQRSPEATPPVLLSAAALLDELFEHPVWCVLLVLDVQDIEFPSWHNCFFRRAGLFTIFLFWTATTILSAAEKISGTLTVHDSLTAPNQPATIEATLIREEPPDGDRSGRRTHRASRRRQCRCNRDDRWRRAGFLVVYPEGQRDGPHYRARRRPLRELPWLKLARTWPCGNVALR